MRLYTSVLATFSPYSKLQGVFFVIIQAFHFEFALGPTNHDPNHESRLLKARSVIHMSTTVSPCCLNLKHRIGTCPSCLINKTFVSRVINLQIWKLCNHSFVARVETNQYSDVTDNFVSFKSSSLFRHWLKMTKKSHKIIHFINGNT